jgi:hypothetical protein
MNGPRRIGCGFTVLAMLAAFGGTAAHAEGAIYLGLTNGTIWKCDSGTANSCQQWYSPGSAVRTLIYAGGSLYAGLGGGGSILKCDPGTANSCKVFNTHDAQVNALTLGDEVLYAGFADGTLFEFNLATANDKDSFWNERVAISGSITAMLYANRVLYLGNSYGNLWESTVGDCGRLDLFPAGDFFDAHIFDVSPLLYMNGAVYSGNYTNEASAYTGGLWKCDYTACSCQVWEASTVPINSLLNVTGVLYAGLDNGLMWRCASDTANSCEPFNTSDASISSLLYANGAIYGGLANGTLLKCDPGTANSCQDWARTGNAILSMAFACEGSGYASSNDGAKCVACTTFDPSCNTCTADRCTGCANGYVLSGDGSGRCSPCTLFSPSCTTCAPDRCTGCASGHVLNNENLCIVNPCKPPQLYVSGQCVHLPG